MRTKAEGKINSVDRKPNRSQQTGIRVDRTKLSRHEIVRVAATRFLHDDYMGQGCARSSAMALCLELLKQKGTIN